MGRVEGLDKQRDIEQEQRARQGNSRRKQPWRGEGGQELGVWQLWEESAHSRSSPSFLLPTL